MEWKTRVDLQNELDKISPYMPIIEAMQEDPDLVEHIRRYYSQEGGYEYLKKISQYQWKTYKKLKERYEKELISREEVIKKIIQKKQKDKNPYLEATHE